MELVPTMGSDCRSIANRACDRGSTTIDERLIELSSWMMVIGTIRIICGFADYVSAFLDEFGRGQVAPGALSRFFNENSPITAVCVVWPLVLGVALRRTRWSHLLLAVGVTLLILSLGGVLELTSQSMYPQGGGLTVGSFHVTRCAFLNPRVSDIALIVMGAIQLLIELAIALRALLLAHQSGVVRGSTPEPSKSDAGRRALIGRLATYVSFGVMMLLIRLPVWSTYLGLLHDSSILREFVISNDLQRIRSPTVAYKLTKEEERLRILQAMMGAAYSKSREGRFLDCARRLYTDHHRAGLRSRAVHVTRVLLIDRGSPQQPCLVTGDVSQDRATRPIGISSVSSACGRSRAPTGQLLEHARRGFLLRRRAG